MKGISLAVTLVIALIIGLVIFIAFSPFIDNVRAGGGGAAASAQLTDCCNNACLGFSQGTPIDDIVCPSGKTIGELENTLKIDIVTPEDISLCRCT